MLELPKRPYQRLSPPHWGTDTDRAFRDKLRTGKWKDHKRSRILESNIARRLDCPKEWVLVTSSCTAALGVAFQFLWDDFPLTEGDDGVCRQHINVCPLTYPATYCWAVNFGWDIEWVDCDDQGWPVSDVDVGVDLWGRPFPGSCVILDAAHRVFDPRHIDGLGTKRWQAVTYSFGPTKEIPCLHGGCLVLPALQHPATRQAAEAWICSGQGSPLSGGIRGYLDAPLAAAIAKQLSTHSKMKPRRQRVLKEYAQWFGSALLTQPEDASGHLAVVQLKTPGHVIAARKRLDHLHIDRSLHYPIPDDVPCPGAKELASTLITLPCNTDMRKHDVLLVARAVQTAV